MKKTVVTAATLLVAGVLLSGCASKQLSGTDTSINPGPSFEQSTNPTTDGCEPVNLVDLPDETFKSPPKGVGNVLELNTNCGNIKIVTDPAAPKTAAAQIGLAQTGYFDQSICHRITTEGIWIVQCGSRLGTGTDGPGYRLKDENLPVGEKNPYPAGTVAMANAGEDSSGSQFFIVYEDSLLPPDYTIWGTVDEQSLETIQRVVQQGVVGGGFDGPPVQPLQINTTKTSTVETDEQKQKKTAEKKQTEKSKKS